MRTLRMYSVFVLTVICVVVACALPSAAFVGLTVRNFRIQIVHKIQLNPDPKSTGITVQDLRNLSRRVASEIKDRIAASKLNIGRCSVTAAPQVLLPPRDYTQRPGFNQISVVDGPVTDPHCSVPSGATIYGCTAIGTRIAGGWSDTDGTWSMNAPEFTYAHEAGHMMGLHGSTVDPKADPIMAEGRPLTPADLFDGALGAAILSEENDLAQLWQCAPCSGHWAGTVTTTRASDSRQEIVRVTAAITHTDKHFTATFKVVAPNGRSQQYSEIGDIDGTHLMLRLNSPYSPIMAKGEISPDWRTISGGGVKPGDNPVDPPIPWNGSVQCNTSTLSGTASDPDGNTVTWSLKRH